MIKRPRISVAFLFVYEETVFLISHNTLDIVYIKSIMTVTGL